MIPKLTANGYAQMLGALDGVGIEFTKIVIGNGEKPDDYTVLTDLQNPLLSAEITEITRQDKYAVLRASMLNSDIEGRLHWTELGIFTKDPDGGSDILYGYAHSEISGDGQGVSIPEYDTNMIELAHVIYVYVGEVENVTAILAQSSVFVSKTDFDTHVKDQNNPHNVTKKDVGLGNVPNVTPENQQPVISKTVTPVDTAEDGTKSLPNIENGDLMGTILQKIRSAIAALVNHLNAKNPHGLKAGDVGAAATTHYHSAPDMNSGTLGIARGGTGASTAADALKNLGAAKEVHDHNYAGASSAGGPATSAEKLETARSIDGVSFDGSADVTHYGTCSTAKASATKVVACDNFKLVTGASIKVKFESENTASYPKLNVNSTGAKSIYWRGASLPKDQYWEAGAVLELVYDGSYWNLLDGASRLPDDALSSDSTYPVQNKVVKAAIDGKATNFFCNEVVLEDGVLKLTAYSKSGFYLFTSSSDITIGSYELGAKTVIGYLDYSTAHETVNGIVAKYHYYREFRDVATGIIYKASTSGASGNLTTGYTKQTPTYE